MLLSSPLAGAGWIHKLNIAVITLVFIITCLVSELGCLKKKAASFQAGIRFWQMLAEGFSEVAPVYLLQAGLLFSFFCCHFPTSSVIHSLLRCGPLGLPEMTLLLDDVSWMTQVFLVIRFHLGDGVSPLGLFGNGLNCMHLKELCLFKVT